MKTILEKLYIKLNVTKNDVYALYNGQILSDNISEDQILMNENNKKIILIYDYDKTIIKGDVIKKSKDIICQYAKKYVLLK